SMRQFPRKNAPGRHRPGVFIWAFPRLREKMAGIFAHFKSVREAFVSSFAPQFFSTRFFTP
ncbi:MAG: hypothetical protein KHY61_08155, partial [Sutterella wadsworthensis]|nr:hypothetical protein [Sutterella wadsworthensis]